MVHLIKNEAVSAELCISHLHLSSTLSPTSLWVGATISRILRHPNRSERERAIGVWDERTICIIPSYLNVWIIILLGTGASNCSWWYYFLFPPPIMFYSNVSKIPLDFFSVSQSSEWYRHPLIFYAVVLFCQLFMHWVLIDNPWCETLPHKDQWQARVQVSSPRPKKSNPFWGLSLKLYGSPTNHLRTRTWEDIEGPARACPYRLKV